MEWGLAFLRNYQVNRELKGRQAEADKILDRAKAKEREIELGARDEALKIRDDAEAESKRRRKELSKEEERLQKRRSDQDQRLQKRRSDQDQRLDKLEKRESTLNKRQSNLDKRTNELDEKHQETLAELEKISGMTQAQAKEQLSNEVEREAQQDMMRIIHRIEEEARVEGERRARELIADAIQRVASDHVSEITVSSVPLPSDDMKGRIIGRNGRNIRAFEQAAGVDVIVDDTPEAVTISCFDSVRREVARVAMAKLVLDGRIHPANIEKIVNQAREDVDKVIAEAGEQAAYEAGVPGLKPEITKKLGRLKFPHLLRSESTGSCGGECQAGDGDRVGAWSGHRGGQDGRAAPRHRQDHGS